MLNPLYLVWAGAVANLAAGLHYTYSTVRTRPARRPAEAKPRLLGYLVAVRLAGVLRAGDRGCARRSTAHALRRRGAHVHLLRGPGGPTPLRRLRAYQPPRHHLRRPRRRDARGVAHHGLRERRGGAQHRLRRPRRHPRHPAGLSRPPLRQSQHLGSRSRQRRHHPRHLPVSHLHRVRIRAVLPRPVPVGELPSRRAPAPPPPPRTFPRCCRGLWCPTPHRPAPNRPGRHPGQRGGLRRRVRGRLPVRGTNSIHSAAQRPSPPTSTAPPIRCGDGQAAAANAQTSC